MADFKPPPQHVPLGTDQASGAKVLIDLPWYRAFQALATGAAPSPAPSPGVITFAKTPSYRYGDLVFTSGPLELTRLGAGESGQVLASVGPGAAPTWIDLPALPPIPAPAPPLVLYAKSGSVLNAQSGELFQALSVS